MTRAKHPQPETTPGVLRSPPDEPPVLIDPRRWGALIGLVGGLVFVLSYGPTLGSTVSITASVAGICLTAVALLNLYIRPSPLGPFREPTRSALLVYGGCVIGELAAIGLGSRLLVGLDQADLRPALVAGVVGLHFLPFAWAFREPLFHRLGLALVGLGSAGLLLGWAGVTAAAGVAAVMSGLVMTSLIVLYSRGRLRPPAR
ncbi:hypothetical protein GCM10009616_14930 [Microlunatus lacustris]